LLRGQGRFLDDLRIDGVAHVVFVRSPHAHARVAALDVDAARKAPAWWPSSSARMSTRSHPSAWSRHRGMVVPEMLYVADDVVRCQGTPVAAVVADSAVSPTTPRARPRRVDAAAWRRRARRRAGGGAPPVVGRDDNRCFTYTVSTGDPDRAFAAAHRVVALDVARRGWPACRSEPRRRRALGGRRAHPSGPRRSAHRIRDEVARLLGWRPSACG